MHIGGRRIQSCLHVENVCPFKHVSVTERECMCVCVCACEHALMHVCMHTGGGKIQSCVQVENVCPFKNTSRCSGFIGFE